MSGSFLEEPPVSAEVQALYDSDLADDDFVWNVSRLWAHQPDTVQGLFGLMSQAFKPSGLTFRQRGILVAAAASALGDSYCSLAWGGKLGAASDATVAAGVLTGSDAGLTDQEKAMAGWARKVARDPNATTPADIEALRDAGLDDGQIFAITAFVAFRLAFSTINDALGELVNIVTGNLQSRLADAGLPSEMGLPEVKQAAVFPSVTILGGTSDRFYYRNANHHLGVNLCISPFSKGPE